MGFGFRIFPGHPKDGRATERGARLEVPLGVDEVLREFDCVVKNFIL
jgi:hypothetical protein